MTAIDTFNKFGVAAQGRGLRLLNPPVNSIITADDALLLAAYLVCMAKYEASHDFTEVLAAVQGS